MRPIALVVLLAGVAACKDKSAAPGAEDPKRAIVHTAEYDEGPCLAGDVEPWPDKTYVEPNGESPFTVFAHGHHVRLARVGAAWIIHDFPHFFTLTRGKVRVLPPAPRPPASHPWQVESIAGQASHLVVEIDQPRHYGRPSEVRSRYTLDGGTWKVETIGATSPSYRMLTWADGKILDIREGAQFWLSPEAPALLDFGAAGQGCPHAYRYLDSAIVSGTTTVITGRACTDPQREFVTRFAAGEEHASPFALAPLDFYQPKYAAGGGGRVFVAGDCSASKEKLKEGCYAMIDDHGWHLFDGPEGWSPQSVAVDGQGGLWLVVGASGDVTGRTFAAHGPAPLGEIYRRPADGAKWERLAIPEDPVDGWEQRRFVAETVAADGDELFVAGYFFYTQKPSPERVRTTRRFAILRLGHDPHPPIELDRKD